MGTFTEPPTSGSSYPDIPVANFADAARQLATGATAVSWWDDLINKWVHRIWDGVTFSLSFLAGGMDDLLAVVVQMLTAMQGINQPGFFSMVAAILGDLLGIEFDADVIRQSFQKRGRLGAMQTVGGHIYDTLRTEFDPSGGTAQQVASDAPARAFLGFLTEFAVRQGNVALFSEMIPIEFNPLGGLREYGELLARNLGLGRLARQALRPLMQVMVADPLLWHLNSIYRPKLLSASQAIKLFKRGALANDELHKILSYEGYSDSNIDMLIADTDYEWHARELLELYRLGEIDDLEVVDRLTVKGIDTDTAKQLFTAYQGEAAQGLVRLQLTELLREVRNAFLGEVRDGKFTVPIAAILDNFKITPAEKEQWAHIFGQMVELPHKHLTESEVERAFLGGILDMSACQDFWIRLGYDSDAVQVLSLLLLQKQSASNRTKAGHIVHKTLSEAQAEKAYSSGLINLPQLQAYWHAMGYSPDDVSVLSALVQLTTPGPGETQFPGMTTP